MRHFLYLVLTLATISARAVSIDAIYFGQTHMHKSDNPYFGTVGNRDVLIKAHVTDPATPTSPSVFATLNLGGQMLTIPLTGPATLPASIPDGLGVVQHTYTNSFTGTIPAAWVKKGLQVTVNAGTVVNTVTNMKVNAPTKVIMTMTDVEYFANTTGDYTTGTFAELEAKWPVVDLEVRRLNNVVFRELVIPPRSDVSAQAVRIKSKAEYQGQTGLSFDGEQAAALEWNGALKRAAGRSGRWSLYYLNVYGAFAGGQAGGYAGVGNGGDIGILHHELGHALSLPHWGDNASYPYKNAMHGINPPGGVYNGTHAGPAWAFHQPTGAFIPPTVQAGNVGGRAVGTYKVDPMQGGGEGYQEAGYLMNHFSDYSVNQMRNYMNSHVVQWNPALGTSGSWAQWNATTGEYTTVVTNDGVQFPQQRDVQVISILASMSGGKPSVNMVYPPIGPYTAGVIRLFDPAVAADRTAAQSIFAPTNGCDYCVRVVQGGVTKTYMLAASALTSVGLTDGGSLETEAINLPAADGAVTRIDLLSTPNVEDVGLPVTPTVFYSWGPLMPATATFDLPPEANDSTTVTMTAEMGEVQFGYTGGTVEYMFTETSGNPGATSSAWQTARTYTDTGLQAGTVYTYTVSMRAGTLTSATSAPVSVTTPSVDLPGSVTLDGTQQFTVASGNGYKTVTGLSTFDASGSDKLVVCVTLEHSNNDPASVFGVRYNGVQMIEAVHQTGGNADGALGIYYLDNPGAVGTGISVSGYNPNGGLGVAYKLSGTRDGFGAFNSRTSGFATSLPLTTSANNSVVIAALGNSGNTNSAGTPTANAPLIQTASGNWGSQWGSFASGYQLVATPTSITPAFTSSFSSSYSLMIAAVEFLAEPVPGSTWTQTAGGAQSWTTASNWIANAVPSPLAGDTVDFSAVDIAANTTLTLGANRTAGLWKFGDTSGTENWTVNAGNTITLAGTTPTIEVVNNTATLNNVVSGSAGLFKTGNGTLVLNANNNYTSSTRINGGTLVAATIKNGGGANPSSVGASPNTSGNLVLNGGTLRYTGPAVSTDRLFSVQASGVIEASGTGALNFTNTGAMGFGSNTAAKTLTLSGTNTGNNTLAAIIGDNTGVTTFNKTGPGTWVLSGLSATAATNYSGTTAIDNGTLRITTTSPVLTGSLAFALVAGGTNVGALDLSAASATFGGVFVARTNSTDINTISIGSGRTLQIGGSFTVGFNATATPHTTTKLDVSGAGTLSVGTSSTPTNANFQIGNGATSNVGNAGILDMSGLTTFYANLGTGLFRVGSPTNSGSVNGGPSMVILAADSTIQAATMLLGGPDGAFNGVTVVQSLKLGSGTNVINVNTLNLGGLGSADGRSNGSLTFNGATGTLKIRSQADPINGRATLNLGVRTMNSGVFGLLNLFDTTGHSADLMFGTMTIGSRITNGTSAGSVTGEFRFGTGTLDANDLIIGSRSGGTVVASTGAGIVSLGGGNVTINTTTAPIQLGVSTIGVGNGTGTLNISGGTVSVLANTGTSILIANATVAGGTATGTLNLTGGTLTVAGDILRGASTGTSNATVKLSGGTLNMNGHDLGAAGSGALAFTVESGTLQNIASINGTGGLTKTTAGTLTVSGTNTYTGDTTISSGTIALGANNALPSTALAIGSATLNAGTFADTLGNLDVTGTAIINLGAGATLAFADSSAIDWSGGTLSITGTFVSGSSIRFGTSNTSLTSIQLAKISSAGFSSFSLNASGYLVGNTGSSSFNQWIQANGTSGSFADDHDNDGIPNGIEFFLGGSTNTTGSDGPVGVVSTSGPWSVTWSKSPNYPGVYGTNFWVETAADPTGTWTIETIGGHVTANGNAITYTFPGSARRFVRLKVTGP